MTVCVCRYIAALRGRLLYVVLCTVCKVERLVLTVLNEYYYYYYYYVRKGRKIASDISAFLYAFAIIAINKHLSTALNTARADAYTV